MAQGAQSAARPWHHADMAFDIFLQRFSAGESASANASEVRALLDAHVVALEQGWARVETADGDANLYGYDDLERGFMVNHAAGNTIWDILVTAASVGPYVIMPTGNMGQGSNCFASLCP